MLLAGSEILLCCVVLCCEFSCDLVWKGGYGLIGSYNNVSHFWFHCCILNIGELHLSPFIQRWMTFFISGPDWF